MSIFKDVSQVALETILINLNNPIIYKKEGICVNYSIGRAWHKVFLIECCKELNCFSGCNVYPIGDDEADAQSEYHNTDNLWDKRTKYGKLRHSVLNLMRDKVSQELSLRKSGVK